MTLVSESNLNPPFNCKVFAFDPSPVTQSWYKEGNPSSADLRNHPNYTLFNYGAGGVNGNVRLNAYDWDQVSIVRFPMAIQRNCNDDPNADGCNVIADGVGAWHLPVRTLGSI